MHPLLGRFGPFFLYSYQVVMVMGLAAGISLTAWRARGQRPYWLDGLLVSLLAALVAGRAAFVWANQDYFGQQPAEIGLVWRGGLSYHGGLLAALLVLWLWSWWRGQSFQQTAGLLAPGLALSHIFGWAACWLQGCAYGRETVVGLLAADLPDNYGVFALRYQTQLIGMALSLLTFLLVWSLFGRLRPGALFWLTLFLLSSGRAAISLLRGDPVPILGPLRLDTWLDSTITMISLFLFLFLSSFSAFSAPSAVKSFEETL